MKLGELARVARGVTTGNSALFIMTRAQARKVGIESFTRSVIRGSRSFPKDGPPIIYDNPEHEVIVIVSKRDVEEHPKLRAYLGDASPRLASVQTAPIAASYVGIPRFVANPDGLVITNGLFSVTPRQRMAAEEVSTLVERLNTAAARLGKPHGAQRFTPRSLEQIEI